jgi:hypothetical protein
MLTNREFSEKLKIPIGKVRRNTKELLGEDPRATRRSGYGREFTINEGWYVFLGGTLVSNHGLTFGQARDALETIKPWLLLNQLVPEPPKNSGSKGVDEEIQTFTLSFYLMEGKISKLFGVSGTTIAPKSQAFIKEPSGRIYLTRNIFNYFYFAKNKNGKICHVKPPKNPESGDKKGEAEFNFAAPVFNPYQPTELLEIAAEIEVNPLLFQYIINICDDQFRFKHPIRWKLP